MLLQEYEQIARNLVTDIQQSNLIKFSLKSPTISYQFNSTEMNSSEIKRRRALSIRQKPVIIEEIETGDSLTIILETCNIGLPSTFESRKFLGNFKLTNLGKSKTRCTMMKVR